MTNLPYLHSQCQKPCSVSEVEQILESIFHTKTFSERATAKHQDEMLQSRADFSSAGTAYQADLRYGNPFTRET